MKFVKAFGKIYDVKLSKSEQAALDKEIVAQLDTYIERSSDDILAQILWQLHEEFGFGETRLRRFYETFEPRLRSLTEYYKLDENVCGKLCDYKLRDIGIDISEWKKKGENTDDQ